MTVPSTCNVDASMVNESRTAVATVTSFGARLRLFGLILLLAFLGPVLVARAADIPEKHARSTSGLRTN